jgi:DNA-binding transcriptional LysR family regulator
VNLEAKLRSLKNMDFRLKVFGCVAQYCNFTKAAKELNISQPAVSKHIHELEENYNIKLFEREGNRIVLTQAGKILQQYSAEILTKYENLSFIMHHLGHTERGSIRIGASTSIAQYILPQLLADFNILHPEISFSLISANSDKIEEMALSKRIDIGMVEGCSSGNNFRYIPFMKDEIVAVAKDEEKVMAYRNTKENDTHIWPLNMLYNIPLVMRENSSGTYQVIEKALKAKGIRPSDLKICARMDSTESIKNYIQHSNCMGMVSICAVRSDIYENRLKIIDFEDFSIEREFSFAIPHGPLQPMQQLFMEFIAKATAR